MTPSRVDRVKRGLSSVAFALAIAVLARDVGAQPPARPDTTRRDTARRDTTRVPTPPAAQPPVAEPAPPRNRAVRDTTRPGPPRRPRGVAQVERPKPPITPRRALLYSMALPGYAQSRLDRYATGAFFAAIEAGALTMVAKSAFDLAEARAFRGDSLLPSSYPVDTATGRPRAPSTTGAPRTQYTEALVRARRLHLEDWLAAVAFNHLVAGAEAFVSANLWDVPSQISARPTRDGAVVALTLTW